MPSISVSRVSLWLVLCSVMVAVRANGQDPGGLNAPAPINPHAPGDQNPPNAAPIPKRITCESQPGERQYCGADMSAGVALEKSTGSAPCLLGKTWGYDNTGVWVSDGCSGEFIAGRTLNEPVKKPLEHIPNVGFLLYSGEKAEIYFRLFSYARYLNQRSLDGTFVDAFGRTQTVQQRQDIQLQKFFSPWAGWFLSPKFRYYLYVWSSNPSQGDPAQVVGAGNLGYNFNRFINLGFGITSLPTTRSTENRPTPPSSPGGGHGPTSPGRSPRHMAM